MEGDILIVLEKENTGKSNYWPNFVDRTDTAFGFHHSIFVSLITLTVFIPENNEVFPKKLIFTSNSGTNIYLIFLFTHILSHTYKDTQGRDEDFNNIL